MMPVRLSVTEVHWRIIANLGFKFRSHFTAHWPPCCCVRLAGESSRAMLASARVSCSCSYTLPARYFVRPLSIHPSKFILDKVSIVKITTRPMKLIHRHKSNTYTNKPGNNTVIAILKVYNDLAFSCKFSVCVVCGLMVIASVSGSVRVS